MDIIKIAELLEEEIIKIVAMGLKDRIIKTDFGLCLNDKHEQVYRTRFSTSLDFKQDTPVNLCRGKDNPVEKRMMSDNERVELFAKELLGFAKNQED